MNTNPHQPDSPQREVLSRMLPGLADRDLANDRQRQLQEFVMNEISDQRAEPAPRRKPRLRFALATAGALAVAAAVTVGVVQYPDEMEGTTEKPAPSTFELAADYAAGQSFDPPSSDQWIYVENQSLATGAMEKDKGMAADVTFKAWVSVDGKKMAEIDPETGKLHTWEQGNEYPELSTLPTDPEKLLAKLRKGLADDGLDCDDREDSKCEAAEDKRAEGEEDDTEGGMSDSLTEDEELFTRITQIMSDHKLPPKVEAALWKAAALIPGVTEEETVEVGGVELIALGQIQEGWRFEQLLVDPETYAFKGNRAVADKDHTLEGYRGKPLEIKKGEPQYETIRLDAKVVDKPGKTD